MNRDRLRTVEKYSVAPYNFVRIPERLVKRYHDYRDLPPHNEFYPLHFNGYIEYRFRSETPIIAGSSADEKKIIQPFKNPLGQYVIPGSTMRGLMRNNAAFLSMSSLEEFISDNTFFYRSFGKGKDKADYSTKLNIRTKQAGKDSVSIPNNIKGGYIYKDSKDCYVILPSRKINNDLTYFVIQDQYLWALNPQIGEKHLYSDKVMDLIRDKIKYMEYGNKRNQAKRNLLKEAKPKEKYKPYWLKTSFELSGARRVSKIGERNKYNYNGFLMSSEKIMGKLAHYIIPEPDFNSGEKIILSRENDKIKFVDLYKDDLVRTKKKRNPNRNDLRDNRFFFLPEETGKDKGRPIFYGTFEDKIYFGYSPYLRIPYDYSIKDLIPEEYMDKSGFTYVDSMFGFSNKGQESNSYKSRLSFEDAVCLNIEIKEDRLYRLITGEPKASAYALYLQQNLNYDTKEIKNYNNKDARIRGIKTYLNKSYVEECEKENGNDNVAVYVKPLPAGTEFRGKIYYENLTKDELGLLAWALRVTDDAFENIGYGKPYGFGRVKVEDIDIYVEDIDKKYSCMKSDYYKKEDRNKLIDFYKVYLNDKFGIDIDRQSSVKDFITLKTLVIDEKHANDARYMQFKNDIIRENEFNKLLPLPNAIELKKIISGELKYDSITQNDNYGERKNNYYNRNLKSQNRGFSSNSSRKENKEANGNGLEEQLIKLKEKFNK